MCCKLCGYFEPIQLLRKGLFLIVNEKNSAKKNMNVYNTQWITITRQYVSQVLKISWKKIRD